MSKLYELVKLRNNLLGKIDSISLAPAIQDKINLLDSIVKQNTTDYSIDLIENFKDNFDGIVLENQKIVNNINNMLLKINQDIDAYVTELFFNDAYREKFKEELIAQEPYPLPEIEKQVMAKIAEYSNWRYPALQINPRYKKWIDTTVANDPLYIAHYNSQLVNELIKDYPELYQNRLRIYEIDNRDFSILPQGQFGFVLCWDNFNHLSLDKIETYIREVWKLLRPGGSFIFNYNNCDLEGPAYRAECYASSYASAGYLTRLFNEIGFEITSLHDVATEDAFNTHLSWVDIRKPGKLTTSRLHQALAQVSTK